MFNPKDFCLGSFQKLHYFVLRLLNLYVIFALSRPYSRFSFTIEVTRSMPQ